MDFLFDLLPFLFVVWVLLRAIRRRPTASAQPSAAPSGPHAPTPFEELIKHIEKAAAEAERRNAGAAPSSPTLAPPPLAAAPRRLPTGSRLRPGVPAPEEFEFRSLEAGPRALEFRSLEAPASETEFHPIYDLTPEERAVHESHRVVPGPAPSTRLPSTAPRSARPEGPAAPSGGLHPLVARLHEPGAARTAFLMKEVLGDRRGERNPHHR